MKRLFYLAIILATILYPNIVFAKGYIKVSPNKIVIKKGDTAKINFKANNAIGDVKIYADDKKIVSIKNNTWETGMVDSNKTVTGSLKIKGTKIGSTKLKLIIDGATFDEEDVSREMTIKVSVMGTSVLFIMKNIFVGLLVISGCYLVFRMIKKNNKKSRRK